MTDLVSQLVGALEDCLDDSRQALADMEQIYSDSYRPWRLVSQRKTIAEAEAALTAAKAGGWVAVPVEPHGYLYDVYFQDEDGDPAGSSLNNFTRSLKYAKDNGTNVRAICILPTPQKEQA